MDDPNLTFGFTEEQKLLRESVLGTLQRVLPPEKIRELDKAGDYPYEACAALAEAGVNGIVYPEEYGGQGGSFMDLAVLGEALGYHYGGIAQAWGITCIYAGMHIALHGSEAMKHEILPRCAWPSASASPIMAPTLPASRPWRYGMAMTTS